MGGSKMCGSGCSGMFWWLTLLVAVLAVPSAGIILTSFVPTGDGFGQVLVFIIACWLCTYLGMRLMQHPKMSEKIDMNNK